MRGVVLDDPLTRQNGVMSPPPALYAVSDRWRPVVTGSGEGKGPLRAGRVGVGRLTGQICLCQLSGFTALH